MNFHTKHIQTSLLALALLTGSAQAETGDRLAEAYRIPQDARGLLVAKVESVEFLKDNEYSGGIQKGYTLPGFRLSPGSSSSRTTTSSSRPGPTCSATGARADTRATPIPTLQGGRANSTSTASTPFRG